MTRLTIPTDVAWQEALAIYALPEVADHLIGLQDHYGCNVNLLLLSVVLGNRQIELQQDQVSQLVDSITQSERQLAMHRELRRAAKQGPASPYEQLKQRELQLEQQQHRHLLTTLNQLEICQVNTDVETALVLVLRYYAVSQSDIDTTLRLLVSAVHQDNGSSER